MTRIALLASSLAIGCLLLMAQCASTDGLRNAPKEQALLLCPTGEIDSTFGTGGKVLTTFGQSGVVRRILLANDGHIIAVGNVGDVEKPSFAIVRYDAAGHVDSRFGVGGEVTFRHPTSPNVADARLQPDGKIVIVSDPDTATKADFVVTRFRADGTLDSEFGVDGSIAIDFGADDRASGMVIQPDGKLVLIGTSDADGSLAFAIARVSPTGVLDPDFRSGGKELFHVQGIDTGRAIGLLSDGRIVVAGTTATTEAPTSTTFSVARLKRENGALDGDFAIGGTATIDLGGAAELTALAITDDNGVVLAGTALHQVDAGADSSTTSIDVAVARVLENGALDPAFGGHQLRDLGGGDVANDIVSRPGRGFALAVGSDAGTAQSFAALNYGIDGSIDSRFGSDGLQTTTFNGRDRAVAIAIQPDGKVLLGGSAGAPNLENSSFALARYCQ